MQQHMAELDELNSFCSAQLSKNFSEHGIYAWHDGSVPGKTCRGGAVFALYDPFDTCFRFFPNNTKYFQASLFGGLISNRQAIALSRELIAFCSQILPRYDGRFSQELRASVINRYLDKENSRADLSLLEAQKGQFPDVLFSSIPRICTKSHFAGGEFTDVVFRKDDIISLAKQPLQAIAAAAEMISFGPGLNLPVRAIHTILEWLAEGCDLSPKKNSRTYQKAHTEKIVIPAQSNGLQGIIFGFFHNIHADIRNDVRCEIRQFAQRLADRAALARQMRFLQSIKTSRNPRHIAKSLLGIMSPVDHLVIENAKECVGYRLQTDGDSWIGYKETSGEDAEALTRNASNEVMSTTIGGQSFRIHSKALKSFPFIASVFSWLHALTKINPNLEQARHEDGIKPLEMAELQELEVMLQHQIEEGRGVYTACRILHLIDMVHQNYAAGEFVMTNHRSQSFMREKLAKTDVNGYQVCGEALAKFQIDIDKLIPHRFLFEPITNKNVRVRWLPICEGNDACRQPLISVVI